MQRSILFLPVFMGAGILLYFARLSEPPVWPALAVALIASASGVACRGRAILRGGFWCVAFAASGFASASLATWRAPPWAELPRTATIITGVVAQTEALPEGRRITIETPSLDGAPALPRRVRVRLRNKDPLPVAAGDTIRIRALVRVPSPPAYPGGWDMQRDAYFAAMAGYGFAIGPVTVLRASTGTRFQAWRSAIAARVMAAIPGERGAIAATLLTGLGAAIDRPDRAAFQVSGLAHLLSVAGLHIGAVMGVFFGLTRLSLASSQYAALHWPIKKIAAIAALVAGAGYLALTGAHVPILRSFAMASLVTLAVLTGRRAVSMRALAVAAMALMLAAPQEVVGVGFQMSFSAVLALIAGWEVLRPLAARLGEGRWWRLPALYATGLAGTSLLAGTASMPFAAYHFGTATLYYIPANMLAVPLTALLVLPLCVAALFLMPFHLEWLALVPAGWGIDGLIAIARHVAAWPGAVWAVPQMPPWGPALVGLGLAWLGIRRGRWRLLGALPILAGVLSAAAVRPPDIVVTQDARVIAARIGGDVYAEIGRGAAFEADAPERVWGGPPAIRFPDSDTLPVRNLACNPGGCRWHLSGGDAMLIRDPSGASPCTGLAVAISAEPLRGVCPAPVTVDRFTVWRDGAVAIRVLRTGALVESDRDFRGDRPWVLRAHTTMSRLPPALTE